MEEKYAAYTEHTGEETGLKIGMHIMFKIRCNRKELIEVY